MSGAVKRLGVAYGKLGLSTDQALIGRRIEGVKVASGKLQLPGIVPLVQAAFGIGSGDARFAFLSDFEADPTFDVQPSDQEAILLAGTVAEHETEAGTEISPQLALVLVACACNGLRQPPLNNHLVAVARKALADFQGLGMMTSVDQQLLKQPQSLSDAIKGVPTGQPQFNQAAQHVVNALQNAANYAEAVSAAAAKCDNAILNYVRSLEQEMRVYWWVTGGWSDLENKPFGQLSVVRAAICAGIELADKHSSPTGLFAAPALVNLVLERGRTAPTGNVTLQEAAVAPSRDWRKKQFADAASSSLASLLPVTSALGLSAADDDCDDWKPRFKRLTGLEPDTALSATELGVQLYRERLVTRALGLG
jgi:hypothetical protein